VEERRAELVTALNLHGTTNGLSHFFGIWSGRADGSCADGNSADVELLVADHTFDGGAGLALVVEHERRVGLAFVSLPY
jgi:hypothetical protein